MIKIIWVTVIDVFVLFFVKFIFSLIKTFIKWDKFKLLHREIEKRLKTICKRIQEGLKMILKNFCESKEEIYRYLKRYGWGIASIILMVYMICFKQYIDNWWINFIIALFLLVALLTTVIKSTNSIISSLSCCVCLVVAQIVIAFLILITFIYMMTLSYFANDFSVSFIIITFVVVYNIALAIIFAKNEVKWFSQVIIFIIYVIIKFFLSKYELDKCNDYFEFFAFYKSDVMDEVLNITLLAYGIKFFTDSIDASKDKISKK